MEDINYPWVEEFRPTKIEDVIGASSLVDKMNEYIQNKSLPHLLLLGTPGVGKTTIAKILAQNIAGDEYLYINASDERGMDTIRTKVQDFCSMASMAELKIVILDEADGLTQDAQKILRAVTEQYAKSCRFILTANYENRILDPVKSRFQIFRFQSAGKQDIAKRCCQILMKKGIKITEQIKTDIIKLVKTFYPDIRSTINNLQKCTKGQEFSFIEVDDRIETNKKLIEYLKARKIRQIREEILSNATDYDSLYNAIYQNVKELSDDADKCAAIIVYLAGYQYQNLTHVNRELNFVACLLEIQDKLK
jgi:replication factor C small subunit